MLLARSYICYFCRAILLSAMLLIRHTSALLLAPAMSSPAPSARSYVPDAAMAREQALCGVRTLPFTRYAHHAGQAHAITAQRSCYLCPLTHHMIFTPSTLLPEGVNEFYAPFSLKDAARTPAKEAPPAFRARDSCAQPHRDTRRSSAADAIKPCADAY